MSAMGARATMGRGKDFQSSMRGVYLKYGEEQGFHLGTHCPFRIDRFVSLERYRICVDVHVLGCESNFSTTVDYGFSSRYRYYIFRFTLGSLQGLAILCFRIRSDFLDYFSLYCLDAQDNYKEVLTRRLKKGTE